jgi:Flp pilus assembly protein TadG
MVSILRRLGGLGRDDRGAELIELAMIFPILMLLVAGMVDFGFLFQRYEVVTNAAREGARIAVLPGYGDADVQQRVRDYLTTSGLTESPTVVLTYPAPVTLPSGGVVQTASVVVEYPSRFSFIGPIAAMVGGSGWGIVTLRAASVMRLEAGS